MTDHDHADPRRREDELQNWQRAAEKKLAENTRRLRSAAGLSPAELARRARVAEEAVADIEEGGGEPSVFELTRLAEALDVDFDALIEGVGDWPRPGQAPPGEHDS